MALRKPSRPVQQYTRGERPVLPNSANAPWPGGCPSPGTSSRAAAADARSGGMSTARCRRYACPLAPSCLPPSLAIQPPVASIPHFQPPVVPPPPAGDAMWRYSSRHFTMPLPGSTRSTAEAQGGRGSQQRRSESSRRPPSMPADAGHNPGSQPTSSPPAPAPTCVRRDPQQHRLPAPLA